MTHLLPNDAAKHRSHWIQLACCTIRKQLENVLVEGFGAARCGTQFTGC